MIFFLPACISAITLVLLPLNSRKSSESQKKVGIYLNPQKEARNKILNNCFFLAE